MCNILKNKMNIKELEEKIAKKREEIWEISKERDNLIDVLYSKNREYDKLIKNLVDVINVRHVTIFLIIIIIISFLAVYVPNVIVLEINYPILNLFIYKSIYLYKSKSNIQTYN